jgi:hypothetical protein
MQQDDVISVASFIPRSWDFLKRLGYFWDFILRNETLGFFLGFFLGFLRNSQEK